MITSPFDDFVGSKESVPLFEKSDSDDKIAWLLWGDGVRFESASAVNGRRKVRARGKSGWVDKSALGGKSLLEYYFIDVGQGDGVLVKTPDFRHILVDGGFPRSKQPTGKSGADFVDWKFVKDYGLKTIALDAMIASHNDQDHYGGLADLMDVAQTDELDAESLTIERAYHAGLSWWKTATSKRTLGESAPGVPGYFTWLLEDRTSAKNALAPTADPALQGEWRAFVELLVNARTASGSPTPMRRLSHVSGSLPAFEQGEVLVKVLAPIEYEIAGKPALRLLKGGTSKNTNGHSILLRIDYGRTRVLLTGDLNKAAQKDLLNEYAGDRLEFAADVAKACHHGSDDVSMTFLQAIGPSATVISSGDFEGHDHPRPQIVAASGVTGHLLIEDDEIVTPLVYSTELARSYKLGKVNAVELASGEKLEGTALAKTKLHYKETASGALRASSGHRNAAGCHVVSGLVYGLVNVRTDGEHFQIATFNEADKTFSTKNFRSRF